MVWLWLALFSSAVLPWAHELSHAIEHPPAVSVGWELNQTTGPASADHDEEHPATHLCQVCAHLWSQHLDLAGSPVPQTVCRTGLQAPPNPSPLPPSVPLNWWRPATRAPPPLHT